MGYAQNHHSVTGFVGSREVGGYGEFHILQGRYALLYGYDPLKERNIFGVAIQNDWLRLGSFQSKGIYSRLRNSDGLRAWSDLGGSSYFSLARGHDMTDTVSLALRLSQISFWIWQTRSWQAMGADLSLPITDALDIQLLALGSYPLSKTYDSWFYDASGPRVPVLHLATSLRYRKKYFHLSTDIFMSLAKNNLPQLHTLGYSRILISPLTLRLLLGYSQKRYRQLGSQINKLEWQASVSTELRIREFLIQYRVAYEKPKDYYIDKEGAHVLEHSMRLAFESRIYQRSSFSHKITATARGLIPNGVHIEYRFIMRMINLRWTVDGKWTVEEFSLHRQVYNSALEWWQRGHKISLGIGMQEEQGRWYLRGKFGWKMDFAEHCSVQVSVESSDFIDLSKTWSWVDAWEKIKLYGQFTFAGIEG